MEEVKERVIREILMLAICDSALLKGGLLERDCLRGFDSLVSH